MPGVFMEQKTGEGVVVVMEALVHSSQGNQDLHPQNNIFVNENDTQRGEHY